MTEPEKTHYRDVFKSDHLSVPDLEGFIQLGRPLVFTIKEVCQEYGIRVAGKPGNFNIAYFTDKDDIKPLVLNAGNSKILRSLAGDSAFVEDWKNIYIELYIAEVMFKGKMTRGIRINTTAPEKKKREVTKDEPKLWDAAKKVFFRDGNFDAVLKGAILSEENMKLLEREVIEDNKEIPCTIAKLGDTGDGKTDEKSIKELESKESKDEN